MARRSTFDAPLFGRIASSFISSLASACAERDLERVVASLEHQEDQLTEKLCDVLDALQEPSPPLMVSAETIVSLPKIGEVFELTLNADEVNLIEIVCVGRGYSPKGWKHKGKRLKGIHTRHFKLEELTGDLCDANVIREELATRGSLPEGVWIAAFNSAYPHPPAQGKVSIAVADPSWKAPSSDRCFPALSSRTDPWTFRFEPFNRTRLNRWLWLVGVNEPTT